MSSPRLLLSKRNVFAKKQYGQNFLAEPSTARRIVEKSGLHSSDVVLEIGAGLGALTIPLAEVVETVFAVEKDPELIPILTEEIEAHQLANVVIMKADILRVDLQAVSKTAGKKITVMGNLPYNISSQVIVRLIENRDWVTRAVLMFQKELARRIAASPGRKEYGRITAMLQYCAEIKPLAQIEAHQFFPKPKVDSMVLDIRFTSRGGSPAMDERLLFRLIKAAFGKRRKTLKNSLSGSELGIDGPRAAALLDQAGIDPSRRAESLSVSEFVVLSNILAGQEDIPGISLP
ncbi:MAG: 16S rRNA (adenine(1518)-N(6)/adenine(1519)-N(6))-dimethyltransferase RsmA [Thermodesulfobacteriota bacterium]